MTMTSTIARFQAAYTSFFGKPTPEVRAGGNGGYYVRHPVNRHYSEKDINAITRFYMRGSEG